MRGERLAHIHGAVITILDKLSSDDMVSIVAFSDKADVVLPTQAIGSVKDISSILSKIEAEGGTEMLSGLSAGLEQMRRLNLEEYNSHLILLTDGHTYGDERECISLIHEASDEGIDFSAFGIGSEWNDNFLDGLVAHSGGQSGFIESPDRVINQMERRLDGIGRIYAQNMRLKVDFPDDLSLRSAYKVAPFAQELSRRNQTVNFGSVEGRRSLSVLLEFLVEPKQIGTTVIIPLVLVADIPSRFIKDKELRLRYELEVVAEEPELDPPQDLLAAVQSANFHQMNERAWQDIQAGEIELAINRLHIMATRLLEAGYAQMGQRVLSELERVMTWGSMSGEGRKALKYGTRSLLSKAEASGVY